MIPAGAGQAEVASMLGLTKSYDALVSLLAEKRIYKLIQKWNEYFLGFFFGKKYQTGKTIRIFEYDHLIA
ncbi:hypothetical protein SAMN04489724_3929 [Algoriphagus locisalis]|uniref:Uncharacterized protein n=1 Tax=Algoriphagus locisalis TaxID=305507 RepID=A0A1I7DDP6_9BACT|nr:hypothetical protein SAMN04489724_3929 [Algoriphagus locisalis]